METTLVKRRTLNSRTQTIKKANINDYLQTESDKTFMIKVKGDSMIKANINTGDVLLVERNPQPQNNSIIVATINNRILVKKLLWNEKGTYLISQNENYKPIKVDFADVFEIWGIVRSVIKAA